MSELQAMAAETIKAIDTAFDGVSREGGMSLHQTLVLDDLGTEAELAKARMLDVDEKWQEVPDHFIENNLLSLNFLDPIGFRYYIPVYMVWEIRQLSGEKWTDCNTHGSAVFFLTPNQWNPRAKMEYFQLLNEEQSRAVYRFLSFNVEHGDEFDQEGAQAAIARYWGRFR